MAVLCMDNLARRFHHEGRRAAFKSAFPSFVEKLRVGPESAQTPGFEAQAFVLLIIVLFLAFGEPLVVHVA